MKMDHLAFSQLTLRRIFHIHSLLPSRAGVLLLSLMLWCGAASTQNAVAPPPSNASTRAGTSDSGDMRRRLRFRAEQALGEAGPTLGQPNGYHWIFLVQVAHYRDSNVRFTDMRRGLQLFLNELVVSRRDWKPEEVGDTVSIIPYHFNLLGAPRDRQQLLRDFLKDSTPLQQRVPGQPQDDKYGDGIVYRDGHDWRRAMMQTLAWMEKEDIPAQNTIIVVLDWNDLAQAPQQTANGAPGVGPSKNLVQPQNPALWKAYTSAMQENNFPVKNLATVQVGNLEYDMAVFAPKDLKPLAAVVPASTTSNAAPVNQTSGGGGGAALLFFIPLLAAAAFVLKQGFATHGLKINDKTFALRAFGNTSTLDILGPGGRARAGQLSYVLPENAAPLAGAAMQAQIKVNLMGKIQVVKGASSVKENRGFKAATNGGVEMMGNSGQFELRDGNDRLLTIINVKRQ